MASRLKQLYEVVRYGAVQEAALVPAGDIDPDDHEFTRITQSNQKLSQLTHDRSVELAQYLWLHNPLAKRLVEIKTDFICGEGMTVTAEQPDVQQVIDAHLNDQDNDWSLKLSQRVTELSLAGEVVWPVFVNEGNGLVKIGFIAPRNIKTVVVNPENAEQELAVKLRGKSGLGGVTKKIIRKDEQPNSPTQGQMVGDVFYFAVNKLCGDTRGRSDLLPILDWLDIHDKHLMDLNDRTRFLNAFVWFYKIIGADQTQITEWQKMIDQNPPKPGSYQVFNDKFELTAVTPDLKAADNATIARIFFLHILRGMGFPEHWLSEGDTANRATAAEMADTPIKMLERRQLYVKRMVEKVIAFQIEQAKGKYPTNVEGAERVLPAEKPDEYYAFEVMFPELHAKDLTRVTTALAQVGVGLSTAVAEGWVTDEQATKMFHAVAAQLGLEFDPMEAIEQQDDSDDEPENEIDQLLSRIGQPSNGNGEDDGDE